MRPFEPAPLTEIAPLAHAFHESSKLSPSTFAYLAESVGEFNADPGELRRSAAGAKTYPGARRVELASLAPLPRPVVPLERVLRVRRSTREYGRGPVPAATIASLLHHACGVTGVLGHPEYADVRQPVRAAPSGGALYPIEVYVAAFEVEGLDRGLHHFHAPQECLELVEAGDFRARLEPHVLTASGRLDMPALVVLSGRWERPLRKYGERGYRVLLLDAGHVAQSLLLVAEALGLGACAVAGFHDEALGRSLGLDPRDEPVLLAITLGPRLT